MFLVKYNHNVWATDIRFLENINSVIRILLYYFLQSIPKLHYYKAKYVTMLQNEETSFIRNRLLWAG